VGRVEIKKIKLLVLTKLYCSGTVVLIIETNYATPRFHSSGVHFQTPNLFITLWRCARYCMQFVVLHGLCAWDHNNDHSASRCSTGRTNRRLIDAADRIHKTSPGVSCAGLPNPRFMMLGEPECWITEGTHYDPRYGGICRNLGKSTTLWFSNGGIPN